MKEQISFHFYIYLSDSRESDGGTIHRANIYLGQLPEMPRYYCPVEISYFGYIKIRLKFKTACQNCQAG